MDTVVWVGAGLMGERWRPREEEDLELGGLTHELTLKQIQQWLDSGCNSPKDKVTKDRLRQRLTG